MLHLEMEGKKSSSTLSRSLSCRPPSETAHQAAASPPLMEDHDASPPPPPTTNFNTKEVINGEVFQIIRDFHEHPLILSAYSHSNSNNDDSVNFCCLCSIYFTAGAPIYSCLQCRMFLHQSCGELPALIHSAWHPQHRLQLKVAATLEPSAAGASANGVLTSTYGCSDCHYQIYIGDALQTIPFSQFKHSYLNLAVVSSSLPLYLKQQRRGGAAPLKQEALVSSRKVDQNVVGITSDSDPYYLCNHYIKWAVTSVCYNSHFPLHQSYARSPKLIKSNLHPEHLLDFRPPIENINITLTCRGCGGRIMRKSRYTCQLCHIDFHFDCAFNRYESSDRRAPKPAAPCLSRSLSFPMEAKRGCEIIFTQSPPGGQGISLTYSSFLNFRLASPAEDVDQINHFLHRHPLVPLVMQEAYRLRIHCELCAYALTGDYVPIYGCYECHFFLHESCARSPRVMRNTLHPEHMLQLVEYKKESTSRGPAYCKICYETDFNPWNYWCTDCGDNFHCKCALINNFEDHKEQEHTFHLYKASLFTCDACGITENKGISSVCTNCPLQVHKRCSHSFPRTVKQKRHQHKLDLIYSFEIDVDYANEICKLCFNQMNNVYCMYRCTHCTYMAHVTCATSKDIVEKESTDDESTVNKIEDFETIEAVERQTVEHFGHPDHHLILTDDEEPKNIDAVCDACVSPISAPFYACSTNDQCDFYLHKHCFQLPMDIQHTLHEHRLKLTAKEEFFRCYGCGFNCNGFKYACYRCSFYLDVRCSLLSDTLNHDGHGCTLTLIDYKYVRHEEDTTAVNASCSVCDRVSDSTCKFSCRQCNFHLDLGCALLPNSVTHKCPKHDWMAHPLQLTYGGIPDASGIYFCDTCEESRDINHWFYDCDDCVWSNHPKCVLGEFQFKYGKTYQIKWHRHEQKLVKKALSRYKVIYCDECEESLMDDSPLFCAECNLYFHHRRCSKKREEPPKCGTM